MSATDNVSSIRSIEEIIKGEKKGKKEELTIEFLRNLIRRSLADYINAEYPLLEFDRVSLLIHTAVVILGSSIEVNTITLAQGVVQSSAENRDQLRRELAQQLVAQAKRSLARFLHYAELKTQGTKISAKDFLINKPEQFKIGGNYLNNILNRYQNGQDIDGKNWLEEIRVHIEGKSWKVKFISYKAVEDLERSKKDKLLLKVKQKLAKLKDKVVKKLRKIGQFLKNRGPQDPMTIELKPFLKGAADKLGFVEDLAKMTLARIADTDITEMAAENLLQTLDTEIDSLIRYVNKVEKIFDKIKEELGGGGELPASEGMILSEDDENLIARDNIQDSINASLADVLLADENQYEPRMMAQDMDWSIKKNNDQNDIGDTEASNYDQSTNQQKPSIFTKIMGNILDPKKLFNEKTSASSKINIMLNSNNILNEKDAEQFQPQAKNKGKFFHHLDF